MRGSAFSKMMNLRLWTGSCVFYPIETQEEYETFLKEIKWNELRG